jgi:hypothetical protein
MRMSDFLLARYAEDEESARECSPEALAYPSQALTLRLTGYNDAVVWNPARVLADLRAKRELVTELARMQEMGWDGIEETVMSFLVQPYADHPEHQDEWDWT